jgi:short-subunit dehydrogenase
MAARTDPPTPNHLPRFAAEGRPVALVTGASAGLGRELARLLVLEKGMIVLGTGRRLDRLVSLRDELPGGSTRILAGDLANAEFRAQLWDWAEGQFGRVDLLVNNAGLGNYADFADQDFVAIRRILEVNLFALMDLTQRAIRHMKPRRSGQILQISSTVGTVGMPYAAAYVASKHAVNGLTKTLRYELKGSGVRVWAACPGRIQTEFRSSALAGRPDHASQGEPVERVARGIMRGLGRTGGFLAPTFTAGLILALERWLPGPFEWFMIRWAPGHFAREIGRPDDSVIVDLTGLGRDDRPR